MFEVPLSKDIFDERKKLVRLNCLKYEICMCVENQSLHITMSTVFSPLQTVIVVSWCGDGVPTNKNSKPGVSNSSPLGPTLCMFTMYLCYSKSDPNAWIANSDFNHFRGLVISHKLIQTKIQNMLDSDPPSLSLDTYSMALTFSQSCNESIFSTHP